jgi:hypothetical protein
MSNLPAGSTTCRAMVRANRRSAAVWHEKKEKKKKVASSSARLRASFCARSSAIEACNSAPSEWASSGSSGTSCEGPGLVRLRATHAVSPARRDVRGCEWSTG